MKVNEFTLIRVTGWKARVLKILLGTPFLIIGGLLLFFGIGDPTVLENLLMLVFGGGFGFFGAYQYVSAIRGDDFTIDYSHSTSQE